MSEGPETSVRRLRTSALVRPVSFETDNGRVVVNIGFSVRGDDPQAFARELIDWLTLNDIECGNPTEVVGTPSWDIPIRNEPDLEIVSRLIERWENLEDLRQRDASDED